MSVRIGHLTLDEALVVVHSDEQQNETLHPLSKVESVLRDLMPLLLLHDLLFVSYDKRLKNQHGSCPDVATLVGDFFKTQVFILLREDLRQYVLYLVEHDLGIQAANFPADSEVDNKLFYD